MRFAKLFPYLLLIGAGAFSVPTAISAFTGAPANSIFVVISSSFLVLAIICLPFSHNSGGDSGTPKP